MPEIKITKFETIPDGMYRFKVNSAEERTSENAQYGDGRFIGWQILVMAGTPDTIGKMISYATGNQFGSKSKAYKFLRALGMPETDKVISINTDDYIGREFVAKVEEIEKDGNTNNKLVEFWSLTEYEVLQKQNLTTAQPVTSPVTPPVTPPVTQPVIPPVTPEVVKSSDGFTYEDMQKAGWKDDALLADPKYSMLVPVSPTLPVKPAAPPDNLLATPENKETTTPVTVQPGGGELEFPK